MKCPGCQKNTKPKYVKGVELDSDYYYYSCGNSKHSYLFEITINGEIRVESFVSQNWHTFYHMINNQTHIYYNDNYAWNYLCKIDNQLSLSDLKIWLDTLENIKLLT